MSKIKVITSSLTNNHSSRYVLIIKLNVSLKKAVYIRDMLNEIYSQGVGNKVLNARIAFYLEGNNMHGQNTPYLYDVRFDVSKDYHAENPSLLVEIGADVSELLQKYELQDEPYE